MKARYLIFYSYIGTSFRSSQKIWLKDGKNLYDNKSIQGLLELGLLKLRSLNHPHVVLSSRTDGGVHALNTSAHFDLETPGSGIYEAKSIAHHLNKHFFAKGISINIKECLRVSDKFNSRHYAKSRTYLYRLAVLKKNPSKESRLISTLTPMEEWKRCHFYRVPQNGTFDIDRFKEGARHLVGYHDFTTFKRHNKMNLKNNRRTIISIEIQPGAPLLTSYSHQFESPFDYWDIEICGMSFVHKQIRRMIGTLISVAIGKLKPEDVKLMLEVPSKHSWHQFIGCGPPDGLYLRDVEYDPSDLVYNGGNNGDSEDLEDSDSESE